MFWALAPVESVSVMTRMLFLVARLDNKNSFFSESGDDFRPIPEDDMPFEDT